MLENNHGNPVDYFSQLKIISFTLGESDNIKYVKVALFKGVGLSEFLYEDTIFYSFFNYINKRYQVNMKKMGVKNLASLFNYIVRKKSISDTYKINIFYSSWMLVFVSTSMSILTSKNIRCFFLNLIHENKFNLDKIRLEVESRKNALNKETSWLERSKTLFYVSVYNRLFIAMQQIMKNIDSDYCLKGFKSEFYEEKLDVAPENPVCLTEIFEICTATLGNSENKYNLRRSIVAECIYCKTPLIFWTHSIVCDCVKKILKRVACYSCGKENRFCLEIEKTNFYGCKSY